VRLIWSDRQPAISGFVSMARLSVSSTVAALVETRVMWRPKTDVAADGAHLAPLMIVAVAGFALSPSPPTWSASNAVVPNDDRFHEDKSTKEIWRNSQILQPELSTEFPETTSTIIIFKY
jgi:hypothetical protein